MREALPILDDCPFCGKPPQIGAWAGAVGAGGNPDATAIECSSDLYDCPVSPSVTGYTRQEAVIAWNRRPARLAALAGAAPVAWLKHGGKTFADSAHIAKSHAERSAANDNGATVSPLFLHAPAKAREVAIVAAVENALANPDLIGPAADFAGKQVVIQVRHLRSIMEHAALATFAEGTE